MAKSTTFKLPKSLAACVDLLYQTRGQRLLMEKEATTLKEKESALREHLINNLPKSDATGISGKVARATAVTKVVPQAKDWDEVYKFMAKKKRFDIVQKRLNNTAIEELWDNGIEVPGVEHFNNVTISLSKV